MERKMRLVLLAYLACCVVADMNDVVLPFYTPPSECLQGCAPWHNLNSTTNQLLWAAGFPPKDAGNSCAIPAASVDGGRCEPGMGNLVCNSTRSSFYGPICACAGTTPNAVVFGTCLAPKSTPEQINLQIASTDTVVVSFVTFEDTLPSDPPQAYLSVVVTDGEPHQQGIAAQVQPVLHTGVAHWYVSSHAAESVPCAGSLSAAHPSCTARNYTLSFVKFANLAPRARYAYKVRSGTPNAPWSPTFQFRALYKAGSNGSRNPSDSNGGSSNGSSSLESGGNLPTRVAIYGDMGNTLHNNMGNLQSDCDKGFIDAIVHLGDHCYDLSMGDDLHGDAYMQAFQPTLATCPWLPVIGNHESTSGAGGDRVDVSSEEHYLNMTFGVAMGKDAAETSSNNNNYNNSTMALTSTANSSLGHLLTKGTFYGAGLHSTTPSRTSQWSSVDIGLIHFVVLDLDPGPPPIFSGEQVAWLKQDLEAAAANRKTVPWIVVGSHFPLYSGKFAEDEQNLDVSLAWYVGEESEGERGGKSWSSIESVEYCSSSSATKSANSSSKSSGQQQQQCKTVGEALRETQSALEPLLDQYSVDIYAAGHVHSYSVTWPLCNGVVCNNTRSYTNPKGTVHLLEGNGGVPNQVHENSVAPCGGLPPSKGIYRTCGKGGAYGRLIAHNSSVLEYQHVDNPTGAISDTWAIKHTDVHRHRAMRK